MLHDDLYQLGKDFIKAKAEKYPLAVGCMEYFCREKPVGFYFDDTLGESLELKDTATVFGKEGLLDLPFKSCIFHCKGFSPNGADLTVWCTKVEEYPDHIIFNCFGREYGRWASHHVAGFLNLKEATFSLHQISDVKNEAQDTFVKQKYRAVSIIITVILMMINHPVYEKKEHEPDAALQRARVKRGKETLSKYIYVNMKPHIKAALSAGDGTIRTPHWRRGHVRRLGDGRVVPVQACLVNWEGDPNDPGAPEKKIYVV